MDDNGDRPTLILILFFNQGESLHNIYIWSIDAY
jgi:hypothetical protein